MQTRRNRGRRTRPRATTIAMKRITKHDLRIGALLFPPVDEPRPVTRGDCVDGPRPCPWVRCRHHLYLDVNPRTGSVKLNFPDIQPEDLDQLPGGTCALDIADRGGATLEEVGAATNLTRERIRQVEVKATFQMRSNCPWDA